MSLSTLKTITTPLGRYTVAWLEANPEQLMQQILNNDSVSQVFLNNDLIRMETHYKDKAALKGFINIYLKQAQVY